MLRGSGERLLPDESLLRFDPRRVLPVGVLPHSFCNSAVAVAGCGFCTFPQEAFSHCKAAFVTDHIGRALEQKLRREPSLIGRPVAGMYFGRGAANLSPPQSFRKLCRTLAEAFDRSSPEVTLKAASGAPQPYTPVLNILREEIPARHVRPCMRIQTFDKHRLRQMGQLGFGNVRRSARSSTKA
jgi:oxygen-independent coproporphyrinogen-3 oxidase